MDSETLRCSATLDQWATLIAVVDCGGVHAAARSMGRSHSAVSAAVLRLQDLVGMQLLEVRSRRSVPTAAGQIAVRHARRLVVAARDLERLCGNLAVGWEPELRVAVDVVVTSDYMQRVLARFAPLARGSRVRVERHAVKGAAVAAADQRFDLVLTATLPPGAMPCPLGTVCMSAVVAAGHPLAAHGAQPGDLRQELQVVVGDTSENAPDEMWLQAERRWTVPDFEVARAVLAAGEGFCIVPREMFADSLKSGELVELADTRTITLDVHLVTPKGDTTGPSASLLAECARQEPLF